LLSKKEIQEVLSAALSHGGDFSEVYFENSHSNHFSLIDGKLEKAISGRDYGVGIRIFSGTNSVYSYTSDLSLPNLIKIAKSASMAVGESKFSGSISLVEEVPTNIHNIKRLPSDIKNKNKIDIMKAAYNTAKNYSDLIKQVIVGYLDIEQEVIIANSEGLYTGDKRVYTRLMINSIANKNGENQSGYFGPGGFRGFEFFDSLDVDWYAKEASRIACTMVDAKYCPPGRMPVIIDSGFGGVIFHEACGHSLEATSVAKNNSVFANKLGQKIASDLVTAIDDGTIPNAWGSINIDDEGTPSQRKVLIENGILKGYMVDKLNGRRMNMAPTGSSRRESYRFAPTSRMTNTFIAPGNSKLEDMISNTEYGLYAKYMGGGSVNPATGDFNFAVNEGYIIKNGKIMEPVRGATLIGKGEDILLKIDMVGDNIAHGQGVCGSISGSVFTNVGQPAIRVSEITVGGRAGV
jgi:TldD protein